VKQILFVFSILVFHDDLLVWDGKNSGLWVWGTTLYLAVLLTVLGKAALVSEYAVSFGHARVMLTVI